ncbi:MAG: hypothetical protein OSB09_06860 [Planctomycetota bacterium]|nr:hypothetical protein [Planctomycetota bacterium]
MAEVFRADSSLLRLIAVLFISHLMCGVVDGKDIESKDSQILFQHVVSTAGVPAGVTLGSNGSGMDWEPLLISVTNKSLTEDAIYRIDCKRETYNYRFIPHNCSVVLEVPANSSRKTLVGIPNSYSNKYGAWRLSCSATRNGVPVDSISSGGQTSRRAYSLSLNNPATANGEYRFLEVSQNAKNQFNWDILKSGLQDVNRIWLSPDQLPQSREVLISFDAVLLSSVDPEDVSAGQRTAIRAAVKSGLTVVLKPDDKGRGLRWIPGLKVEPQLLHHPQTGMEAIKFPVQGIGERVGTHCVQVDDGVGRWIVLEKPTDWYDGEKLATQKSPLHLSFAMKLLTIFTFRYLLNQIDESQHPPHPLMLMLPLGFLYVLVLWPLIGIYLKRRNKLPHMLWIQPVVVGGCVLLLFLLSIFRLGVAARHQDHVLVIRSSDGTHALAAVIESAYTPIGGPLKLAPVRTLAPQPLPFGADLSSCQYQQQSDGSLSVTFGRRVRSTSHWVRFEIIPVNPMPQSAPGISSPGISKPGINGKKNEGFTSSRDFWNRLLEPEAQGKWFSGAELNRAPTSTREGGMTAATIGVMRTTASAYLEEGIQEHLGVGPNARITVWNGIISEKLDGFGGH